MKIPLHQIFALAAILALPVLCFSQEDSAPPLGVGGFDNHGSATFGYRFTDVKGYQPKFDELFGLKNGARLLDFSLFGQARGGKNSFADDYSATVSGLGGDPYSSSQLTVRKNKVYDLRANFRQSRYCWNRNDTAALPNGLDGLTSNHNWATVRKMGSINLLVHATNNLRFTFEYYRNTRDGVTQTTRSLDYFGSSSTWGSFARANPYLVVAPFSEETNRMTGGIDYTRNSWAIHYRIGYQSFNDSISGTNAVSLERSINIDDPATAAERVNGIAYSDSRRLSTPVSEFSYTGKLSKQFSTRGGYIFYRYQGPATLDMAFDGTARTNTAGSTDALYTVSLTTRAHVTEPNQVVNQGFTYKANDWWSLLADYRYSRFTLDSSAQFRSVNAAAVATGTAANQWMVGTSTLDVNVAFTPIASLLIRAGVRLLKEDVKELQDGIVDPLRSKRIKTAWPTISLYYQPSKMVTVRGDIDQVNIGTSYTAITPHTDIGGRFSVRFRPTEKFYLEDSGVVRNRTLLQTDYRSTVRSNAISANYAFEERITAFAGFSYDSIFASGLVSFLRGTAPFTNLTLRDQTVNRIWQLGFRAEPIHRVGFTFTGNFVRSTGLGEIQGELPLSGPLTFPYATGSLYYDVPQLGRMAVNLQRTYYAEELVPGNNFSANLLTIAWTKGF